ncbi:MAG: hypothetical protein ACOYNI_08480 [Acidimicrobiia bacterium]
MADAAADVGAMHLGALPRRDAEARARLAAVGNRVRPVVRARDRALAVAGPLGSVLAQGVARGSVVTVEGAMGAGATTLALQLAAAATDAGEWAAAVEPDHTLGALAAREAGVALERFVVVRNVDGARVAAVTAALLDGVTCVVARAPNGWRIGDARRLVARARERGAVLVVQGAWPESATVRLRAEGGAWPGLDAGHGLLAARRVRVRADGRGVGAREVVTDVAV